MALISKYRAVALDKGVASVRQDRSVAPRAARPRRTEKDKQGGVSKSFSTDLVAALRRAQQQPWWQTRDRARKANLGSNMEVTVAPVWQGCAT